MVAGYIEALDGELTGDAAEQIRGENQGTFEQNHHHDGASGEIDFDFFRQGIEAAMDDLLIDEDALDVVFLS